MLYCKFNSTYSFRTDDLKFGELVGEDKYGNKYYENNMYFYGKLFVLLIGKLIYALSNLKKMF